MSSQTKKKIVEILVTALLSALIAFLQNLLAGLNNAPELQSAPSVAGAIGATLAFFRQVKSS